MVEKIPKLNIPVDYIITDSVDCKQLSQYGYGLYRINAGIFILCTGGNAQISINLKQYTIEANDFIILIPDSFLQIHKISPDIHLYLVGFAPDYMAGINLITSTDNLLPVIMDNPVTSLCPANVPAFKSMYKAFIDAYARPRLLENKEIIKAILLLIMQGIYEIYRLHNHKIVSIQNRENEIYRYFMQLVLKHYREKHGVAYYADQLGLSLPHFCTTVKKASGRTPLEIIASTIILDAKAQLRSTNLPIKKIALMLGFSNISFFNKFFKRHTGVTPKHYRID